MKEKFSIAINCVSSYLLTICVLWCLASSFEINVNSVIVLASITIFSGVFCLLSVYAKKGKQFLVSLGIIGIVFVVMALLSINSVISQVNYLVNCILKFYSTSFPVPTTVKFASSFDNNANIIFVILGFLLSAINTISLVRAKRLIPSALFCVICLIPCFVLVYNPPAIVPLITIITILISLYFTAFFRKFSFGYHGTVFISVACIILILSIIVYSLIPVENYKRFGWQDNLLKATEKLFDFGSGGNSDFDAVLDSIDKTKNLAEIGPLEQRGIKTLEVKSPKGGNLYLKGVAYANYNENEWSVLTDEQAESFPENFDAYNLTKGGETQSVDILTQSKHDILYTPYYPIDSSASFKPVYDILLANNDGVQSYDFRCYTDFYNYKLDTPEYDKYVEEIYTKLPDSTKEKMLKIAEDNNLLTGESPDEIVNNVKAFISQKVYYSLNTEKMPDGEDFPVWFLNDAESGYCVHYATSATVMLRALGIPARYVTGYYISAKDNSWTVVTSDNAHAWVEYYDFSKGWVVLEATPSSFQPVSNTREDIETIPATKPTATVAPTTKPAPTQSVSNNGGAEAPKKTDSVSTYIILISVCTAIFTLIIRYHLIKSLRKKHFNNGKYNIRAIYIYRYIEKIQKLSNNVLPDRISEIANKAKFSNHRISREEIDILLSYATDAKDELYRNSSKIKKLYYSVIKVI